MLFFIIPLIVLVVSVILSYVMVKRGKSRKRVLATQMLSFLFVGILCCAMSFISFAAEDNFDPSQPAPNGTSQTEQKNDSSALGLGYLAAGLATGLSGIGGGIAVGGAAPAAIGATSEDPKAFGKSMIFVALGEGVALYGLLISILILGKL